MATLEELTARAQVRRDLPPPPTRRALRNAVGASLDDVASVVGVTRQAVSMWELVQRAPSAANLERYLEVIRTFKKLVVADTGVRRLRTRAAGLASPGAELKRTTVAARPIKPGRHPPERNRTDGKPTP